MRNFFTTIFVISTLVILGFSSNIFADESIESIGNAGQSSSSQRQIDEIIVTSRKIEENIQQVPVAVYAVDEKALDDFRPTTMRDMDSLAPNLQIGINSASGNQGAIFVRGCGYAEVEKTQNPPVGLIVDGLFMGTNTGTLLDAFDWSKVQVNSGPQGVVYGKNTSCGNLIVERNRPSRDFEFDTEISIGDYDHHEFGIIMNIPLSENVSSRWNFRKLGHEGYYNNLFTGEDSGALDIAAASARFLIEPNEITSMYIVADWYYDRGDTAPVSYSGNPFGSGCLPNFGAAFGLQGSPTNGCAPGAVTATELSGAGVPAIGLFPFAPFRGTEGLFSQTEALPPHVVNLNFPEQSDMDMVRFSFEYKTETLIGELTATTAYLEVHDNVLQDFDGTPGLFGGQGNPAVLGGKLHTARNQHYSQISQEIRLNSQITEKLNLTSGIYLWKDSIFLQQHTGAASGPGGALQTSGQDTESIAIFALARYDITDKISISGGFRYVDESKTFHTQYNAMLGTDIDPIYGTVAWTDAPIQNPRTTKSDSWDDYMGDATIDWQATEDNLFYIRYARGFRSGGYSMRQAQSETLTAARVASLNAQGFPVTQQAHACEGCDYGNFDPELTEMFEIGSKNSFMNDTLQINGAIFQTTTEGFQAQAILSTPGALSQTDTYINNYQETEISGAELTLYWLPPIDGLSIRLNLGFLDPTINEASVESGRVGVNGAPVASGQIIDLFESGIVPQLARIPETSFSFTVLYEHELTNGDSLNTNITYRGYDDQNLTTSSAPDVEEGYELIDATLTYDSDNWSIALVGRNLTDEEYRTHSLPAVRFQGWGDPQTWMVELRNSW